LIGCAGDRHFAHQRITEFRSRFLQAKPLDVVLNESDLLKHQPP
jgi:hypothetical protein